MRLPRMTTRRWMIAVGVVAVFLAARSTSQRWAYFRQWAAFHAGFEQMLLRSAALNQARAIELGDKAAHYSRVADETGEDAAKRQARRFMSDARVYESIAEDARKEAAARARRRREYEARW
jgi:hypothetical protein